MLPPPNRARGGQSRQLPTARADARPRSPGNLPGGRAADQRKGGSAGRPPRGRRAAEQRIRRDNKKRRRSRRQGGRPFKGGRVGGQLNNADDNAVHYVQGMQPRHVFANAKKVRWRSMLFCTGIYQRDDEWWKS